MPTPRPLPGLPVAAALLLAGLWLIPAVAPAAAQGAPVPAAPAAAVEAAHRQSREALDALAALIGREPALPPALLSGKAAAAEVGAALAALSEARPEAVTGTFHRLASDIAWLSWRTGEAATAAQFAAYATAAINVMLADIARRYDAEAARAIATGGRLGDVFLNAGKAAALAESRLGEAGVPLDLQLDTAARLAAIAAAGSLDGAAEAEVVTLWNAHRKFEPVP